jgi:uracil-DNA glycosylase family 4
MSVPALRLLEEEIHGCVACPRLRDYLADSRAAHPDYWSRPVAGFGDPEARLFILGLAPGFHGANRHGRVFTGDDSGRWLWDALHRAGAASQPDSRGPGDGMELHGVWISNAVRCVPPQNRPLREELDACRDFLRRELAAFPRAGVVLALGRLAHESYLKLRSARLSAFPFSHGAEHRLPGTAALLVDSFHPSRQNTNTGVLTRAMWHQVIERALHHSREMSGATDSSAHEGRGDDPPQVDAGG